jgi:PleD family two-component response regulator
MHNKPIRILLMEDNAADAAIIREALNELMELRSGQVWLSPYELCEVGSAEEAIAVLAEIHFDMILAGLPVSGGRGLATFRLLKANAPSTPLLVLVSNEDPQMTIRLVQEGAQDVLAKPELDCLPLGRAIRAAMERFRIQSGLRQLGTRDELTGLLNPSGLIQVGARVAGLLAERKEHAACALIRTDFTLSLMQAAQLHDADWALVEMSEMLRGLLAPVDVAAYLGEGRFFILKPRHAEETLKRTIGELLEDLNVKVMLRLGNPSIRFQFLSLRMDSKTGWDVERALETMEDSLWNSLRTSGSHTMELASAIH